MSGGDSSSLWPPHITPVALLSWLGWFAERRAELVGVAYAVARKVRGE